MLQRKIRDGSVPLDGAGLFLFLAFLRLRTESTANFKNTMYKVQIDYSGRIFMLFSKKLLSKAAILLAAGILSLNYSSAACADGGVLTERQAVTADALASRCSAEAAVLYEANTESFILECESEKSVSMGHFAKLMTVYLTAEKINSGELTLEDTIKASQKANSQTGTVIWLDAGEEIPVSELLKSVIIGNANDGCVALAEGICGDEKSYVEAANSAAVSLDLKATHFEDITGMNKNSVTCAKDIAKLCGKLLEYDFLQKLPGGCCKQKRNGYDSRNYSKRNHGHKIFRRKRLFRLRIQFV